MSSVLRVRHPENEWKARHIPLPAGAVEGVGLSQQRPEARVAQLGPDADRVRPVSTSYLDEPFDRETEGSQGSTHPRGNGRSVDRVASSRQGDRADRLLALMVARMVGAGPVKQRGQIRTDST